MLERMEFHSVMQNKANSGSDSNSKNKRRLKMRRMKSAGDVNKVHSVAGVDAARCSERRKRMSTSKDGPASQDGPEQVRHETKKLKEMVGNVAGEPNRSSYDFGSGGSPSSSPLSFGSISVMGRSRVMEDALTVAPGILPGDYEFFAAYDGHGGATVAHACRERLHQLLDDELKENLSEDNPSSSKGIDWNMIMEACFFKMDEEVQINHDRNKADEVREEATAAAAERGMGSTAVVVMVGPEELVVANCGDSRAVLCRGGLALPLSDDHKPDRPDEKERVEAAGGRIINWDGSRVQGVLATSRSIGDHYLKPYVISKPEVRVKKRTALDEFLVIATDGLWDVVTNDMACKIVKRCYNGQINNFRESVTSTAAAILAELAIAKGSRDNISAIVVDLKKASTKVARTSIGSTRTF